MKKHRISKKCLNCDKVFSIILSNPKKYCSIQCFNLFSKSGFQKGHKFGFGNGLLKSHTAWNKNLHIRCNTGRTLFKTGVTGENNHNWIKDRNLIKGRHNRNFHDPEYKQWVINIYKKDNYKCRINNQDCMGRIEAHHIMPWKENPELRYNINNGITLCHAHHPRVRAEEKRLIPFFQELVSVSNEINK